MILVLAGCSPDMKDGLGPRVPVPSVTGEVTRRGAAVSSARVELRDAATSARIQSTLTDAAGDYGFAAEAGSWEVRVSGSMPDDFAAVTREFSTPDGAAHLAPIDIAAYGAAVLSPADGTRMTRPSATDPIFFRWRPPTRAVLKARVQVYDSAGVAAWYSDPSGDSTATGDSTAIWDGTVNQGAMPGSVAPSGRYEWRVKFSFPDGSEGRTERREMVLQ